MDCSGGPYVHPSVDRSVGGYVDLVIFDDFSQFQSIVLIVDLFISYYN